MRQHCFKSSFYVNLKIGHEVVVVVVLSPESGLPFPVYGNITLVTLRTRTGWWYEEDKLLLPPPQKTPPSSPTAQIATCVAYIPAKVSKGH